MKNSDEGPIITSGFAPVMFPNSTAGTDEWMWKSGGLRARIADAWRAFMVWQARVRKHTAAPKSAGRRRPAGHQFH